MRRNDHDQCSIRPEYAIEDNDGMCVVVTGVKNGLFQKRGCLKGDEECRVVDLWKMTK